MLGRSTFTGRRSGRLGQCPETCNLEPLRKLTYPIGLSKRLTIDTTLSFVNHRPSLEPDCSVDTGGGVRSVAEARTPTPRTALLDPSGCSR
ncbi:hypothetical protein C4K05_2847 [Pseudomonas chlororaphis subsp. aureofaciens]|nr:hypothetical protein C4K14_2946 [Pseudomonas chlororaphis subsp. aureofaciens]AZD92258.1 hypothetical protein C4K13_2841 [Pseudomonas chlororaphis subsp. aureofaciens]AZD98713.1 hypothetical protein C4K12_2847 [Pseudomonas chlororaphis subsp. aureofaciens]AZE23240.1 hypothetical protein C4K08_2813 [Pseudomonas chlororaphis subsp. aureofaciens]AZE35837.1 hypothetical protein C4K06_2804 [Pseudomonas chlororaphis subsp. aureofaciens]